jgi:dipeptidyl aminopeptidase/acylaminoacyl peptidase
LIQFKNEIGELDMRQRMLAVALALFVGLSLALPAAAAKPNDRLTVDLFLDWQYVAAPQISPDGKLIAYTRHIPDKINDRYEDEIWLVNTDGTHNRFFVKGSNARWSPDGRRIAYVAPGQPAGAQIFVRWMDGTGDEATQLTRLERAPSNLNWSPDGRHIAFTMLVPATPQFTVKMPSRPNGAKWIDAPRVVENLNYRADGSGFRPDGFLHIFMISDEGGVARQLTDGDYNHGAPEWMPDSNTIVFSAVRQPDAEYIRFGQEIYALNTQTREIKQLTDRKGPDLNPVVSPDGHQIAYIGYDLNDDTYNVFKLYVMNADGSNKRALTESFDRSPAELKWSPDGRGIYFVAEDRGATNIYFVPAQGGEVRQITTGAQQINFSTMSRNGVAVGTLTTSQQPPNVVVFDNLASNPTPRRITNVNADILDGHKLGAVEEIWYDSVGGKKIQGWIVKPPDFDPSKKYPLILYIHGGPHAMYGVGFNFEFQNHAASDYVVLYTNPRGSTGYGKEFGNAINNNYPGEDYNDLMNGVDAVIKRGYIDERNLFVTGGSGGGVLTSWIVGHTDRFAAAVAMKPVINWYSFVGTTDGADWYYNFKQLPWVDPAEHLRRSPITYVGNVKTPTMLLTGELDLRTPMEQTEQFYRALKLRRIPTAMVRLADEYHGFNGDFSLRHPSNRVTQILYLRGWFEKFKRKDAPPATAANENSTNGDASNSGALKKTSATP